jgi:hypothetical protein
MAIINAEKRDGATRFIGWEKLKAFFKEGDS